MVVATFVFWLLLPILWVWYLNSALLLPFGIAVTEFIFLCSESERADVI
jgi:hypothetical protein